MKNRILAALCGLSMLAASSVPVLAGDDSPYKFYIETANAGYNSSMVYKNPGNGKARIYVSDTYEKSIFYKPVDKRTNFIVIASNAQQISDPVEASKGETKYSRFWATNHEGAVMLRGNSTQTGVDYIVAGNWNPNY